MDSLKKYPLRNINHADKESKFSLRKSISKARKFYLETMLESMRMEVYDLLENLDQENLRETCKCWLFFQLFEMATAIGSVGPWQRKKNDFISAWLAEGDSIWQQNQL